MGSFEEALARGAGWAFLTVFGAGVATSLTPCVYPMIPITVSIFGARESRSRGGAFLLATMYVLGIATMYAALGVMAAVGGWAAGSLLASAYFVIPLALFFLAMASSMFGLWEIRLPYALQNRIAAIGGAGMRGAFLMGLVGGILIAPCTGPVLAGVLAYVATTGSVALGASLLFTYALGIGVLFWVIATFAVSLPKAGGWMDATKSILGLALVVAALYYLQPVAPLLDRYSSGSLPFLAINLGLVALGLGLGAVHLSVHGTQLQKVRKGLGIAVFSFGALGSINYLLTPTDALPWMHDEAQALAAAARTQRPLLIDFSAKWCVPCREMEANILSSAPVRRRLAKWLLLKIDVTDDSTEDRQLQRKYRAKQLPQIVLLAPNGRERARAGKVTKISTMLGLLKRAER